MMILEAGEWTDDTDSTKITTETKRGEYHKMKNYRMNKEKIQAEQPKSLNSETAKNSRSALLSRTVKPDGCSR